MIGIIFDWVGFVAHEFSIYFYGESRRNLMTCDKIKEPSKNHVKTRNNTNKVYTYDVSHIIRDKILTADEKVKVKHVESCILSPQYCTNCILKNILINTTASRCKLFFLNNLENKIMYEKQYEKHILSKNANADLNSSEMDNNIGASEIKNLKCNVVFHEKKSISRINESIMRRIKEAYQVCPCKTCNCVFSSKGNTPHCCKGINSAGSQKYKVAEGAQKAATQTNGVKCTKHKIYIKNTAEPCEYEMCKDRSRSLKQRSDELSTIPIRIKSKTNRHQNVYYKAVKSEIQKTTSDFSNLNDEYYEKKTIKFIQSLKLKNTCEIGTQCCEKAQPVRHPLAICLGPFTNTKLFETRHCETFIGTTMDSTSKMNQTNDFIWPYNHRYGMDLIARNLATNTKTCQHYTICNDFKKCEKEIVTCDLLGNTESNNFNVSTDHNAFNSSNTHLNKSIGTIIDSITDCKPIIDKTLLYKPLSSPQNNSVVPSCSECNTISIKKHKSQDSCNSSGYDCSNYLIKFPRNTVEGCISDVMKDLGKKMSLTRLQVAISSKQDEIDSSKKKSKLAKKQSKSTSVSKEMKKNSNHKSKKQGQTIQKCDCQPCDHLKCPFENIKYSICRCSCNACTCCGTCLSEEKSSTVKKHQSVQTNLKQQLWQTYCQVGINTDLAEKYPNTSKSELLQSSKIIYRTLEQAKAFSSDLLRILEKCDKAKIATPSNNKEPEVKAVAIQNNAKDSCNSFLVDRGVQSFASKIFVTIDVGRHMKNHNSKDAHVDTSFDSLYNARLRKSEVVPFPSTQYTTNYKMNGAIKLDLNMSPAVLDNQNEYENSNLQLNALRDKNQLIKQANLNSKDVQENLTKIYHRVKVIPKHDAKNLVKFSAEFDPSISSQTCSNTYNNKDKNKIFKQNHVPEHQNDYKGSEDDITLKRKIATLLNNWKDTITEVNRICNNKLCQPETQKIVCDSDASIINTEVSQDIKNCKPRSEVAKYSKNKETIHSDIINKFNFSHNKATSKKTVTDAAENIVTDKITNTTKLISNIHEGSFDQEYEKIKNKSDSKAKTTAQENADRDIPSNEFGRKIVFRSLKLVSDHTIILRWDPPKCLEDVQGYELLVDGKVVQRIMDPYKCLAVLASLPETDQVVLTLRTVSSDPRNRQQSSMSYNRQTKLM